MDTDSKHGRNDKDVKLDEFRVDQGDWLTTEQGVAITDDRNSLKVGSRGPTLLEDFMLREKITHFDHERIPERVVHARGSGAHGFFQVYEPMAKFSRAKFLQDPSVKTPVFVRFSTVGGSRGSADTVRDVRGFATRFYTEEGNFDLVGNNMPVFFIQDAIQFPDFVHAVKAEPQHEMPQASSAHDTFWDFISLTPESTHTVMWLMSDRALPRSFSMMEGFGVHTFRFVNEKDESRFVKFHWKPVAGMYSLAWDETQKIAGKDPDFNRRDLWESIERGIYPEFEFGIQIIEEKDEFKFDFDVLDATKLWPEELVPVRRIGKMTLNRNPDNFFTETEQVAFCPGNVVPGIDFSDDPLLQGRLFSYIDTQLSRLGGPNFTEIPINRPIVQVRNNQRDGHMRQRINMGRVSYEPNSLAGDRPAQAPVQNRGFVSHGERLDALKVRERSESFGDHFSQATLFWASQSEPEKQHIVDAFRFELGKVETVEVRERVVALLENVDPDLAAMVAEGIGLKAASRKAPRAASSGLAASAALSIENSPDSPKGIIKGLKVAVLAADGVDGGAIEQLSTELKAGGARAIVISRTLGAVRASTGKDQNAGMSFLTADSVLFDAVFVPGGEQSVNALMAAEDAVRFVSDAFRHCKAIGVTGEGAKLIANLPGVGSLASSSPAALLELGLVLEPNAKDEIPAFVRALGRHRFWARQKKQGPA